MIRVDAIWLATEPMDMRAGRASIEVWRSNSTPNNSRRWYLDYPGNEWVRAAQLH